MSRARKSKSKCHLFRAALTARRTSISKRHLAQEGAGNAEKSDEEVKATKSYASLMNWYVPTARDVGMEEELTDVFCPKGPRPDQGAQR